MQLIMPPRIEKRAIIVPGPSGNVDVHEKAAATLADFGIDAQVSQALWRRGIKVSDVEGPLATGALVAASKFPPRSVFTIGTGLLGGDLAGLVFLKNPQQIRGAILISPLESMEGAPEFNEPHPSLYEKTVSEFTGEYLRSRNIELAQRIGVMVPEGEEDKYLLPGPSRGGQGAKYVPFSVPEGSLEDPNAVINHVLTTGKELEKLAKLIFQL
jgi:hypothetical protein